MVGFIVGMVAFIAVIVYGCIRGCKQELPPPEDDWPEWREK